MFGYTFYHGIVEKYIVLMMTIFNQVYITRKADDGNEGVIRVPITVIPKDKTIVRVEEDPDLNRPAQAVLPAMTLELKGWKYRSGDKLNSIGKWVGSRASNKNVASTVYNPVPYDFYFDLTIQVKNVADGLKIMEQIVPFFTPDWTPTVKVISDPEIILDIPIVIDPIDMVDTSTMGNFDDSRIISWKIGFTLKGFLFGPTMAKKVIKLAKVNVTSGNSSNDPAMSVIVEPGLTANGEPTSNAAASVPTSEISWEDDYGIVVTIEDSTI